MADTIDEEGRGCPDATLNTVAQVTVDLPDGYKRQNAKFDHFGVMNMMKAGGSTTIYFDDLTFDGQSQDFAQDPTWYGWGNRASYQARDVGGVPTRLLFGLEEVWENDDVGLPQNKPTHFKVIGRYFSGNTCLGLDLTGTVPANACRDHARFPGSAAGNLA